VAKVSPHQADALQRVIDEKIDAQQRAQRPLTLLEHGGDRISEARQGNDMTLPPTRRGDDPDYLTARIARDRPDILAKMKAGDYPSVRAAALETGRSAHASKRKEMLSHHLAARTKGRSVTVECAGRCYWRVTGRGRSHGAMELVAKLPKLSVIGA